MKVFTFQSVLVGLYPFFLLSLLYFGVNVWSISWVFLKGVLLNLKKIKKGSTDTRKPVLSVLKFKVFLCLREYLTGISSASQCGVS